MKAIWIASLLAVSTLGSALIGAWTLTGDADFGTSNRLGGGTLTGFRFTVRSSPTGDLPVLRTQFNHAAGISDHIVLYRRYATNAYAPFCDWDQEKSPVSEDGGLLLPAGDYMMPASISDPAPFRNSLLLSGVILKGEEALNFFQLSGGTNYGSVASDQGGNLNGFKFNVAARTDGLGLIIDQVIDEAVTVSGSQLKIWRRQPSGAYALYCAWKYRLSPAVPGLSVPAGDYLVETNQPISNPTKYKYTVLLSGSYLPID